MNLYRIHCPDATRYAGSMAEARTKRQELVDTYGIKKASIEIEDYDFSTKKTDIVIALNAIAESYDAKHEDLESI